MTFLKRLFSIMFAILYVATCIGCSKKQFRQQSASMEPTIKSGEIITVDLSAYDKSTPKRWDMVVFKSPIEGSSAHWVSRIVGLPGEVITIDSGDIYINEEKQRLPLNMNIENYQLAKTDVTFIQFKAEKLPFSIPKNNYFVLGDNVTNALDSRYWGGLEEQKIIGKVIEK